MAYTADYALEEIFEFPRFKASKLQSVSDAFIYVIVPPKSVPHSIPKRNIYVSAWVHDIAKVKRKNETAKHFSVFFYFCYKKAENVIIECYISKSSSQK